MALTIDRARGQDDTHQLHRQNLPTAEGERPGADPAKGNHHEQQQGSAHPGWLGEECGDRPGRRHARSRAMKGRASRGVDATLAAIATLTAAWPVSTLLAEPTWVS